MRLAFTVCRDQSKDEDNEEEAEKVFKSQLLSQFTTECVHMFCSCGTALFVIVFFDT